MITITLSVDKKAVYEEAAKTTDFNGAKNDSDGRREKVLITDYDAVMLDRFWAESVSVVNDRIKSFIQAVSAPGDDGYTATLEMSGAFDTALVPSIETSLFSFFVASVVSKWMALSDKGDAESYAAAAVAMLTDVMRKLYHKKKPVRPVYD